MSKNIKELIVDLDKSIITLEKVVIEPVDKNRFVIDSAIKRFDYTFEFFWKTLGKKLVEEHGVDVHSPKKILEKAYTNHLIDNEKIWLAMLEDRNLTSHTYKETLANEIFERIKKHTPFLRSEFEKCFRK